MVTTPDLPWGSAMVYSHRLEEDAQWSKAKSYLVTPDGSGQTPFAPTDPPVFETGVLDSDMV